MKKKPSKQHIRKALGPCPSEFPAHLGGTAEEWRVKKRQE